MDKLTRRGLLRALAGQALSAAGTVVLARAALADTLSSPEVARNPTDADLQTRVAELTQGTQNAPITQCTGEFRNLPGTQPFCNAISNTPTTTPTTTPSGGGGAGFSNGGGGGGGAGGGGGGAGVGAGGFRNGGGGFRNGGRFRNVFRNGMGTFRNGFRNARGRRRR